MNLVRSTRAALAVVALAALAACGGGSTPPPAAPTATNRAFTGALSTGDVLAVDVGTPPASAAAAAAPAGSVAVSGTITLSGGGSVDLSGYYVAATGQIVITGGGYELTGTFAGGALSGTFTIGGTPVGAFFAADSTTTTPTTYCGTYTGGDSGRFVLLVAGGSAFATVEGPGVTLRGTAAGGHVALTTTGASMDGTYTASTASGTWTHSPDTGTWTASVAACPVPPAPPPPGPSACNLDFDALAPTTISATKSTATMPQRTGGSIPPGTYVLSAVTYYEEQAAGPDSFQERAVIVVDASTFGLVRASNGSPGVTRISGPYTASGGTLAFSSNACTGMGPPSGSVSYVMNGGELWLQGSTLRMDKFTRVP